MSKFITTTKYVFSTQMQRVVVCFHEKGKHKLTNQEKQRADPSKRTVVERPHREMMNFEYHKKSSFSM